MAAGEEAVVVEGAEVSQNRSLTSRAQETSWTGKTPPQWRK
ncbi:hypothetical protein XACG115_2000001 [Xanthomonas citri pv. citri]|nr:hypothetical protein XACG115_2000001 [Xanthomonas citri pv. citri]